MRALAIIVLVGACGGGGATPIDAHPDVVTPDAGPYETVMLVPYWGVGSVTIADLDGDGKLDLTVAGVSANSVSAFLNTTAAGAPPSFGLEAGFAAGFAKFQCPTLVAVGDLDGDGKPDLAVVNCNSAAVYILVNQTLPGDMVARFADEFAVPCGPPGAAPSAIALADFNGDGLLDLVVASGPSGDPGLVAVILNTTVPGTTPPTFAESIDLPTTDFPFAMVVGDFNDDGKPDLAVANTLGSVTIYVDTTTTGAPIPSFAAIAGSPTSTDAFVLATADFNGDGKPDLAVSSALANAVSIFLNTTTPGATMPSFADKLDVATAPAPVAVLLADVDGDGKPDLVTGGSGDDVTISVNTTPVGASTPSFAAMRFVALGLGALVAAGDLDGDGKAELAFGTDLGVDLLLSR